MNQVLITGGLNWGIITLITKTSEPFLVFSVVFEKTLPCRQTSLSVFGFIGQFVPLNSLEADKRKQFWTKRVCRFFTFDTSHDE